jgi:hypothetical protein
MSTEIMAIAAGTPSLAEMVNATPTTATPMVMTSNATRRVEAARNLLGTGDRSNYTDNNNTNSNTTESNDTGNSNTGGYNTDSHSTDQDKTDCKTIECGNGYRNDAYSDDAYRNDACIDCGAGLSAEERHRRRGRKWRVRNAWEPRAADSEYERAVD